MIVGVIGLVINVIGLFMFGGGHGHSHGGVDDGAHEPSHDDAESSEECSDDYNENGKSVEEGLEASTAAVVWTTAGHKNGGFTGDEAAETGSGDGGETDAKKEKKEKKKRNSTDTDQMNIRGVFLHVLADALGSIVVIISAGVILGTDPPSDPEAVDPRNYVDPALSIVLVVIILASTWPLLRDSSYILMQTIPPYVDMEGLRRKMLDQLPEVEDIHEFHVWRLVGNKVFASVHAMLKHEVCRSDHMLNAKRIKVTYK